jgi:nucleoside phosphorylase/DNA repair ATPase RecN
VAKKEVLIQKAVILTALPVEYSAVKKHLVDIVEDTHPQGTVYERGTFICPNATLWHIGIAEIGAGNSGAAFEAERAIAYFQPDVILFVGVAGGIKDVDLGDVVAATHVYGYESGKEKTDFLTRPDVGESSYFMIQRSMAEAKKDNWLNRIADRSRTKKTKAFVAPIAAGEKVIASTRSSVYKFIKKSYNDAIAVEMEGRGFLKATHANGTVLALVVRGISDLVNKKRESDEEGFQEYASDTASAFAFEVIANIDTSRNKKTGQYFLVLSGTISEFDKPKVEAFVDHLKKLSDDTELSLVRMEAGSVILVLEGTYSGFIKLQQFYESGILSEKIGYKVLNIKWKEKAEEDKNPVKHLDHILKYSNLFLNKIELCGFKTFADATSIDFGQNITAIVGPNGSGKSNIVDAIRFVLGNESPKSLRSGQMADVIFSGSSNREPSEIAEVSLVFSGIQGVGPKQDELQISHRFYRSGESEYFINNKSCRLKDIRELFMDTKIGISAYSIIDQGKIDQLLKPSIHDRRVIFEEAAGIHKLKSRKKEALCKLDRIDQNLLRLADIANEVQRSIKLQAGKALNYLEYSKQLKKLRVSLAKACQSFEQKDIDSDELRNEIKELYEVIEGLDNLDVDAIAQQSNFQERHEFLTLQVEDLNKSKVQLEQLIARINKESSEKFQVTFENIREHFQQIFRKLFGGGKADIILENPEDILESGIEIVARPPGKETCTISLLAGGEKTMTAIALLFAVLKSKPSQFCVLDEVDTALDEANNERFNLIVREFQEQSQFIIITHSKRTMSIADALYGITMQTQGVSKKISVQFDQRDADSAMKNTAS